MAILSDFGLIENYKEYLQDRLRLKQSSIKVYISTIKTFLAKNPDINKIDAYNEHIIEHSIKKRTNVIYSVLKSFISFAITDRQNKAELLDALIVPEVKEVKTQRRYLNDDELINVINHLNSRKHKVIALIQKLTGVRVGDIMKIKKNQIVPDEYEQQPITKLILTDTKRDKKNIVAIHDNVAQEILWDYLTMNESYGDYVFLELSQKPYRKGNPDDKQLFYIMNYKWYSQDLKQALEACGIAKEDFATHDFRRCFGRKVWDTYKDLVVLQRLLNHNSPQTSIRYLDQSGLRNIDYLRELQK